MATLVGLDGVVRARRSRADRGVAQNVVGTSVIVPNAVTFDVEDGNRPFGGYGVQASSVRHGDDLTARPVLLSKEVGGVGGRLR